MSLGRAIGEAVKKAGDGVTVGADADGAQAEVDVVETDRLGVRVTGVRVRRAGPCDVAEVARELPDRLRSLPERVEPVEVEPGLGGAILRTVPEEMREREFFEIGVKGSGEVDVKRLKATDSGREPADWTLTHRDLERLIDELS